MNFKKRNNIHQQTMIGKSRGVDQSLIDAGRFNLKEITTKYNENDWYNLDECAIFFRSPPNKTLSDKKSVKGIKLSKARITVSFCSNQSGTDKWTPIVIYIYKRARCFGKNGTRIQSSITISTAKPGWLNFF